MLPQLPQGLEVDSYVFFDKHYGFQKYNKKCRISSYERSNWRSEDKPLILGIWRACLDHLAIGSARFHKVHMENASINITHFYANRRDQSQ